MAFSAWSLAAFNASTILISGFSKVKYIINNAIVAKNSKQINSGTRLLIITTATINTNSRMIGIIFSFKNFLFLNAKINVAINRIPLTTVVILTDTPVETIYVKSLVSSNVTGVAKITINNIKFVNQ